MPTKLILIRHGRTQWTRQKRYCGHTDIGLDETGLRQARRLHKYFIKQTVDKVYASDLRRARVFARKIFTNHAIEIISDLREMNFGVIEGMKHNEIIRTFPKIYTDWINDPRTNTLPAGETFTEFRKRVMNRIKKIVSSDKNKTVAIVTHAGPISTILSDILNRKNIWKSKPDTAGISVIEFNNNKARIIADKNKN